MNVHKSVTKIAGALSLCLLATGFAHAQGLSAPTGSTDIYGPNFQKAYASASVTAPVKGEPTGTGSTDMWTIDFQKVFATKDSVPNSLTATAYTGSTDMYTTNFQRASL
jgi:hypothetical protein